MAPHGLWSHSRQRRGCVVEEVGRARGQCELQETDRQGRVDSSGNGIVQRVARPATAAAMPTVAQGTRSGSVAGAAETVMSRSVRRLRPRRQRVPRRSTAAVAGPRGRAAWRPRRKAAHQQGIDGVPDLGDPGPEVGARHDAIPACSSTSAAHGGTTLQGAGQCWPPRRGGRCPRRPGVRAPERRPGGDEHPQKRSAEGRRSVRGPTGSRGRPPRGSPEPRHRASGSGCSGGYASTSTRMATALAKPARNGTMQARHRAAVRRLGLDGIESTAHAYGAGRSSAGGRPPGRRRPGRTPARSR